MVKIIREGKLPEETEYQVTCHYCECMFTFKQGEAEQYNQYNESYLAINCPTCGHSVTKGI